MYQGSSVNESAVSRKPTIHTPEQIGKIAPTGISGDGVQGGNTYAEWIYVRSGGRGLKSLPW